MKVLVTGSAGFIGMHVALRLLERGDVVIGVDDLNNYYEVGLKQARLEQLLKYPNFSFIKYDIVDQPAISKLFTQRKPDRVVHLAAQASVSHSLSDPNSYIDTNIKGFMNILDSCKNCGVEHLVYASSSSVYGGNEALPYSEHINVDHPLSIYAATKKANELMAHTYSQLYEIPTTGLRFFTVYGPWGRPDMALFLFAKAMQEGNKIDVFNGGKMSRDFTYIDDIVEGLVLVLDKPATPNPAYDPSSPDPATASAPYRVFNIGNGTPTPLMTYIAALESALGIEARKNFLPMRLGDTLSTAADTSELENWVGFRANTPVSEGVRMFADWYLSFYKNTD